MKGLTKALLPALIAAALIDSAHAQNECEELEGTPPGLYTTTDEGKTFLIKDDKLVEMSAGESGFADESGVRCIKRPPQFLDWPCSTQAARSRMFTTYELHEISSQDQIEEIVRRYFDIPEVIAPIPNWIDGEYHGIFSYNDLVPYSSNEYWYHPSPNRPFLDEKRPRSLLVSLYVGLNEVVIDKYAIDRLRAELGTNQIPVTFVFNDTNVVPISYFGSNVSLEEVRKAFFERGIKLADVPMWWLGDYHLRPTVAEFEQFFDIPPLSDIDAKKQEAIRKDLEESGFSRKPIIVSVLADSNTMVVDQPERLRVAASMGIDRIPTAFFFVEPDAVLARCGPGTPVGFGSSAISGETTPAGGAIVPPGVVVTPPPPDPEASDS
ncbi:MAG: hypothetical protein RQ826_06900 [Xanthomonadales bacterium]|nr:hypothetical protein [Xanthomonadales bacterium]